MSGITSGTYSTSPAAPTVLGVHFEGMDPSAALLRDGRLVAFAEEERFTREKHAFGAFPLHAVRYCLEAGGIGLTDVDCVAVGWAADKFPGAIGAFYLELARQHGPLSAASLAWQQRNLERYTPARLRGLIEAHLFQGLPVHRRPAVRFVEHHLAHAAAAFFLSPFDEAEGAAILTADGHGEDDCTNLWVAEGGRIRHLARWRLPASLGWFYTKFTQHFGFRAHDGEGKLMGLAAYGQPDEDWARRVAEVVRLTGDERVYQVEPRFFLGEFADGHYTAEWLELFGPPRARESAEPFTQRDKDRAYAVQAALEAVGSALADEALRRAGKTRLCVAGGTFMNCKLNGVLAQRLGFPNLFALPAAGDNGISLGAALGAHHALGYAWREPLRHLYYGPAYDDAAIEQALIAAGLTYRRCDDLPAEVAGLLAQSKVVGWFQGRMEAGARALGARSILANPLDPEIAGLVNGKIKFREAWRPFCPVTTVEDGPRYFDYEGELPFMIVACAAREGVAAQLPSVVHVDGTVRVQALRREANPRLYGLLEAFGARTGHPVLLNTSFNVKGEPIVCAPEDAVACFLRTGMDALAVGDFLVTEKPAPAAD